MFIFVLPYFLSKAFKISHSKYFIRVYFALHPRQPSRISYSKPSNQNLLCTFRSDMKAVSLILAHCSPEDVNSQLSPRDSRTPLHLASSMGNLAIAQLLIWVSLFSKFLEKKISHRRPLRKCHLNELMRKM